jgi:uroporphyrinogen-III synthase
VSPVIEIVPTGLPLPTDEFDALIVSSAQVFKFLSQEDAQRLWPLPLFCVGSRSAVAALRRGFPPAVIIAPDAKTLTPQIAAKFSPPIGFLYLAGEDRKPDLEADLAAAQFDVTVHEIYRADPAEKLSAAAFAAIDDRAVDAILHYSRRSAELFLGLTADAQLDVTSCAHVCLSADCAAPLKDAGLPHVFVADTPDETSLFAKLTGFSLS